MGLIADTYEDSSERAGQFRDAKWRGRRTARLPRLQRVRVYGCPLCSESFASESKLEDHIFEVHRHQHAYLVLNGHVHSFGLTRHEGKFSQLGLHFQGVVPQSIQVTVVEGHRKRVVSVSSDSFRDLTRVLPLPRDATSIVIEAGGGRSFEILLADEEELEFTTLDRLVTELEEELLKARPDMAWNIWQERFAQAARNQAEARYLMAHYDYLFAYWLEMGAGYKTQDSGRLYERAFGVLQAYNSARSAAVQRAIAFKLNWFDALPKKGSVFALPAQFFLGTFDEVADVRDARVPIEVAAGNTRILLDPFHLTAIECVQHLYRNEDADLVAKLKILGDFPQASADLSHRAKVALLSARYHRLHGNLRTARDYYLDLENHEIFGQEASAFVKSAG